VRQGAEEGDSVSDENRDASDDEALDESGAEEALDCDSSIDLEVVSARGGELGNDFGRSAGHLFDFRSWGCGEIDRPTA